jgi:hypothetical protein
MQGTQEGVALGGTARGFLLLHPVAVCVSCGRGTRACRPMTAGGYRLYGVRSARRAKAICRSRRIRNVYRLRWPKLIAVCDTAGHIFATAVLSVGAT